jgi:hypothetical protein
LELGLRTSSPTALYTLLDDLWMRSYFGCYGIGKSHEPVA